MDIFVCHATEDKEEIARPIAERLEEAGWQVWFDEFELRLGDRLRAGIDEGLGRSRYGAVILSPHFLARKPWTEHELDGLMSREVAGGGAKVIADLDFVLRGEDGQSPRRRGPGIPFAPPSSPAELPSASPSGSIPKSTIALRAPRVLRWRRR